MTEYPTSKLSLPAESVIFAGRLLRGWRRYPAVPIQGLLFPTALLVFYHLLAGESMVAINGTDNLERLVPMCALAGGMFGAISSALSLQIERGSGLLRRFWTQPVHRMSAILGRLLAEALRTFLGVLIITAVGVALGLRFSGNLLGFIPYLLLPVLVVLTFSVMVTALSLRATGNALFMWLGTSAVGLTFCSPGIAPVESFPGWLQPIVAYQPMAPVIESMRALSEGEPALGTIVIAAAWIVGLALIFCPLVMRQYRLTAETAP
ncbi:peptide ABC transporter permease [Mycolicibacterium murale]|jgi:ABC-2 type transport system permease protein|uniref:Transport permease protein n=1 Tax=Mycolicibacterium murale TaxID=182220 RepID=A0A7I9WS09_9MYCO|nr:ABC transporter permease [Mycolicibacterium murale]ANW64648.1 hypothetical protein BCA37_14570 [Mycobacterium sp. djl-10]GFG59977.1 peptide ABC transporter permease [Mycolicibacterium murale]